MAREYKPSYMDDDQNQMGMVPVSPGTQNSVPTGSGLAAPKTQRKASSGFVNLKNYFNANQGNQMGKTLVKPVEQQLSNAQQNLQTAQQTFNEQLSNERGKLQNAQSEAQKALGYIDTGANPMGVAALPQDATEEQKAKAAVDANKAAAEALAGVRDYNYAGPTEIPDQQKLTQDKFQLDDFAQASKDEAGRDAILQTMFGKGGRYSSGSRNLDNFLLSTDQDNLQRLRDIRSQTQKFGQNIRKFDTEAAAKASALKGDIGVTKDVNKNEMQRIRDKVRQDLEAQAAAYNAAQKADAQTISDEELLKYIPEMTGYTLEDKPNEFRSGILPVQNEMVSGWERNGQATPQWWIDAYKRRAAPIQPTEVPKNWINLFQNTGFDPNQMVDPNKNVAYTSTQSGGLGHRDWKHDYSGRPNTSEAYIDAKLLRKMFSENYKDNTWDSIDAQALERRNVLSQVLADNVDQGLMTPKEKNEIEVKMDNQLLEQLKGIPKLGEEAYTSRFMNSNYAPVFAPDETSRRHDGQQQAAINAGFRDWYSRGAALGNINRNSVNQIIDIYSQFDRERTIARKLKELGLTDTVKTGLLNPNLTFKGGIDYDN